jgi:ADP-ribose pyrophosphatase
MKAWKRIEPTKVTKVGHRTVVTKTFELPDGRIETFDIKDAEDSGAVAVVALTREGKVLLFRQFRPGVEQYMDELPDGGIEPSETDIAEAVKRELLEETGYTPGAMQYLGKLNYDAYSSGWRHYFLAEDCEPDERGHQREPNEEHGELLNVDIAALIRTAKEGRMTDPGGVFLAYDKLQQLRENK